MRYLLDTDTLSNLLRPSPSPHLVQQLALTPQDEQATSTITAGELYFGAWRRRPGGSNLLERIEATLANTTVLAFDTGAARVYGELRAELERLGTPIGDADTRIAAIALVHDLTVVTANVRHFERVPGLPVENWLQ